MAIPKAGENAGNPTSSGVIAIPIIATNKSIIAKIGAPIIDPR